MFLRGNEVTLAKRWIYDGTYSRNYGFNVSPSFETLIGSSEQHDFSCFPRVSLGICFSHHSEMKVDERPSKMKGKSTENSWLTTAASISLLMWVIFSEKKLEKWDASSSSEDEVGITRSSVWPIKLFKRTNVGYVTIVRFTQLCSKFPPTALLNFACVWLALDMDISFGRLTSPSVWSYIPIES